MVVWVVGQAIEGSQIIGESAFALHPPILSWPEAPFQCTLCSTHGEIHTYHINGGVCSVQVNISIAPNFFQSAVVKPTFDISRVEHQRLLSAGCLPSSAFDNPVCLQ